MPPTNYLDAIAQRIHDHVHPDCEVIRADYWPLYRLYAVLLLAKGTTTTAEDVHNAWTAWANEYEPVHRSAVPFAVLTPAVQALDAPYVEAIHAVASHGLRV